MKKSGEPSCHLLSYGPNEVKSYAEKATKLKIAFTDPTIGNFLKTEASGKKILDIGCGTGKWSQQAAQYGAKSVDGFDKQEKMVKLAKKLHHNQVQSTFN